MRTFSVLMTTFLAFALGCGKPQPPAVVPAPPAQGSKAANPLAKAPSGTAADASAEQRQSTNVPKPGVPSAEPNAPPDLVALAARLVERDPDGDWRISEAAALELEKRGPEAGGDLLSLLKHSSVDVRRGAAFYLLGNFNASDAVQVAAFSALLADPDRTVRGIGLSAVKQMHEKDIAAAVPEMVVMLDATREDQPDNRAGIARLLGKLKSQAAAAAEPLQQTAGKDPEARVRSACLVALSQIVVPTEAIPAYRAALADADAAVRLVAAARLRSLGPEAAPAAAELGKALADADPRVADAAAEALIRIGPAAVPPIIEQLGAQGANPRKLALACLAKLGPAAKEAKSAVEKLLQDEDAEVRQLAGLALQRMGAK